MRRMIAFALVTVFVLLPVFSYGNAGAGPVSDGNAILNAISKVNDPKGWARNEAQKASVGLSLEQRLELYEDMKVNVALSTTLSALVGFGTGQIIAGDFNNYSWVSKIDWTGLGIVATGALLWGGLYVTHLAGEGIAYGSAGSMTFMEYGHENSLGRVCMITTYAGLGMIVAGHIIGGIQSLVWGNSYNSSVREGLGLDSNLQLAMAPHVGPGDGVGLTLMAKVSL